MTPPGEEPRTAPVPIPRAPYTGILRFGEIEVPCYTLADGTDLLTGRGILRIFAGHKTGTLGQYIARIPGVPEGFSLQAATPFRPPDNNAVADGYLGSVLIDICTLYVQALAAGTLHPKQVPLAVRASVIVTACAKAGVTAAIWEATGFDKVKAQWALQEKVALALRDEAGKWQLMFTPEFFLAMARLFGLSLTEPNRRPMCFSAFLREFFYEWFDMDVYAELRRRNPRPHQGTKHHQFLTDAARSRFERHAEEVMLLMKTSSSIDDFRNRFNCLFRGTGLQLSFGGMTPPRAA